MNDNFDDEERINLALNTDFDSALLDCLHDDDDNENEDLAGDTSDFSASPVRPSSPIADLQIPRLPSFLLNDNGDSMVTGNVSLTGNAMGMDTTTSSLGESTADGNKKPQGTASQPVAVSAPTTVASRISTPATTNADANAFGNDARNNVPLSQPLMHPLAIQSSASCPSVNNENYNSTASSGGSTSALTNNNNAAGLPGLADPQMAAALQAAFATSLMLTNNPPFNPALIPLAFNALAAGVDLSNFLPQFQAPASFPSQLPEEMLQQQQPYSAAPPMASISTTIPMHQSKHSSKKSGGHGKSGRSSKRRRSGQNSSTSNKRSKTSQSSQPPFQIFDAPVELRQSFMQAQRSHGMPVLEDNNSYYFGMTVNGFHPQRSLEEPFMYKSLNPKRPLPDPVPVIDARHVDTGSKRLKNAKEQKRAHRISELIDQLRVKMEKGGWKVGIKSKFHTLSSCSDYLRHLIKLNKEKEAAVKKAKDDLQAKQKKIDEEKTTQQDPSEPESTTSSLTVSSRSEQANKKKPPSEYREGELNRSNPKHYESHESTVSSGSSEGIKRAPPSLSIGATSSVSDITDSNKGGSTIKGSIKNSHHKMRQGQESDGTVSSEAAVASKAESKRPHRRHEDVVVAVSNKSESGISTTGVSMTSEKTSLDRDFELDYEEVFLKSNVPQILASTNGRIVAFNNFFLKATGLTKKEVEFLTIFSLVQTALLSNLFEIVAAALRTGPGASEEGNEKEPPGEGEVPKEDGKEKRSLTPLNDYAAITLPCVDFSTLFQNNESDRSASGHPARKLFMTVTLMSDSDVRKRCFHCAFTDCPGTKGTLGTVTPELLSALFSSPVIEKPTPQEQEGNVSAKQGVEDDEVDE